MLKTALMPTRATLLPLLSRLSRCLCQVGNKRIARRVRATGLSRGGTVVFGVRYQQPVSVCADERKPLMARCGGWAEVTRHLLTTYCVTINSVGIVLLVVV